MEDITRDELMSKLTELVGSVGDSDKNLSELANNLASNGGLDGNVDLLKDLVVVLDNKVNDTPLNYKALYRSWMNVVKASGHKELEILMGNGEYDLQYYEDWGRRAAPLGGEDFHSFAAEYYHHKPGFFENEQYRDAFRRYFLEGEEQSEIAKDIVNQITAEKGISNQRISVILRGLRKKMLDELRAEGRI